MWLPACGPVVRARGTRGLAAAVTLAAAARPQRHHPFRGMQPSASRMSWAMGYECQRGPWVPGLPGCHDTAFPASVAAWPAGVSARPAGVPARLAGVPARPAGVLPLARTRQLPGLLPLPAGCCDTILASFRRYLSVSGTSMWAGFELGVTRALVGAAPSIAPCSPHPQDTCRHLHAPCTTLCCLLHGMLFLVRRPGSS